MGCSHSPAALVFCLLTLVGSGAGAVDMPDGYRLDHYRAATPQTVPGGTVVTLPEAQAMVADGKALILDVVGAGRFLTPGLEDEWLVAEPRHSLPGAVWLPNVGRGTLTPQLERYYRENLQRLTGGRKDNPILIFCIADCWMAWNAVKRAASYGYQAVYWYREGTDGWREAGLPLIAVTPEPLPPED
ncbi:MAG: PQQ-dependent catabolism-associated CXXCW motif protein [Magnetospiraceae bacterium]